MDNNSSKISIKCSQCQKEHERFWDDFGADCNSVVFMSKEDRYIYPLKVDSSKLNVEKGKMYIECGYGSKYDLSMYEIKNIEKWSSREGDVICDNCIDKLCDDNEIVLVNHCLWLDNCHFSDDEKAEIEKTLFHRS